MGFSIDREMPSAIVVVDNILMAFLKLAMFVSGFGLAVLMFSQVILRLGNSPFLGFEELSVLLGLWCYFSGIAYATRARDHISGGIVDLCITSLPAKYKIRLLTDLLCTLTIAYFLYHATKYFNFVFESNRASVAMGWPRYMWVGSVLFGFALSCWFFIYRIIEDLILIKASSDSMETKKA